MPVSYLICAAGEGSRTKIISNKLPKPFLKIDGKTFLQWSLSSLPITQDDQVIILHSPHMQATEIHKQAQSFSQGAELILQEVSAITKGQLETAFLAFDSIPAQNSVAIYNSDTYFECPQLLEAMNNGRWQGLIPCSQQEGDAWSFCSVEDSTTSLPKVDQVSEKRRISEWCSVGFYWYQNRDDFAFYAKKELDRSSLSHAEAYVAPMYNAMIADGLKIGMPKVTIFKPMGSLEQIELFWHLSLEQIQKQNQP